MWIWTLLLVACSAQYTSNRVASLSTQFIEASGAQDPDLKRFYDEDAMLSVDNSLGFGRNFKGPQGVALFLYRMLQAIREEPSEIQIVGVDEARGIALIRMDVKGQFVRSGKNFSTTLLHVLEWNQLTGKIVTHVVLDTKPSQTLAAYATNAEAHFEKLLLTLFRSSYEELLEGSSPLWDLVADNIKVKLNAYPSDLLTQTEWQGKDELLKGFREMGALKQNMPLYKEMVTRTSLLDAKVLASSNSDVWVRWGCKRGEDKVITHVVAHYIFDQDGKLVYEETTLAHAARPWQVYPFPTPKHPSISASEIKKLRESQQRSSVGQVHRAVSFENLQQVGTSGSQKAFYKTLTEAVNDRLGDEPIVVHVDGDVNTRIWGFDGLGKLETPLQLESQDSGFWNPQRPVDFEIHGDMKTSIVAFGEGDVDKVKFVGSIDDLKVEKPKVSRTAPLGRQKLSKP